ncbi:MAG: S9 family peptidase [bacterium]|nr:S9 family peptidase [bacterium]
MPKKTRLVRKSKKRAIKADDLYRLRLPTSIALSPDEKTVAYTVERMDEKKRKYYTNLCLLDLTDNESTPFTHGDFNDRMPVWSPDGSEIAFVSARDKKTGIYIIPSAGGAERRVIELDAAISSVLWTPEGDKLLLCLRYNDSHFIEEEKRKKEPPVYRHVTRFFFRLDGLGYLPQDKFQLYELTVATGKLKKLTKGKRDNFAPALSRDGKQIAYVSNRSKDPDMESLKDDLFVIPSKGGKERRIATPPGPIAVPTFSPDGKTIAYIGHSNPNDAWGVTNLHVWKVGVAGRPTARDLMPKFDRMTIDQSISDMGDVHDISPIFWSADGKRILFVSSDTGVTNVYYVPAAGGKPTRVFKGKSHIKAMSIAGRTKTAAVVYSDLTNPGDICTFPTAYGGENRMLKRTDFNPFLKKEVQQSKTKELFFRSFDGTRVQGFLTLPPNFNPNRRYPAILQIHGGPRAQYAFSFFHEMQYLAAQGYVVFYTNPRGGSGRGETWAEAIAGGWGDLDYKDCMAAADYLESLKYVNSRKIGVTGGSYGGYMTNWMIGHTNRFKAAVTQRSVVDLRSFVGSSDIGFALDKEFAGYPWNNEENYTSRSPITYFKRVKTPVLIIHSEQDLRCHIEQADQMFVMLKALGKKVEMVHFPEEPHGLSRNGRPDRRIARLEWISKWFNRYLK